MNTLPAPEVKGVLDLRGTTSGQITLRVPRSVHAALLDEARPEGVSLDQLCVSKLVAQLRDLV